MSDWNEEQAKAKAARRGIVEQRGNVKAKKKHAVPGRHVIMHRIHPESTLAKVIKGGNAWKQYRDLSFSDLEEAKRLANVFARKNTYQEFYVLDTMENTIYPLKGN